MRSLVTAIALSLTLICAALAHSPVKSTQPANGASVAEPPETIVIEFDGDVRLTKVTVTSDGGAMSTLDLSGAKSFAVEHTLSAPDLSAGMYTVEWRALAKDGHAMKGSFSFSVK